MAIHKEGYKILAVGFIILLIINIIAWIIWSDNSLVKWIFLVSSVLFFIFILFFFRLPVRNLDPDPELIYAPADGKVVVIEETFENEYFKDTRLQISIFMSPFKYAQQQISCFGTYQVCKLSFGDITWLPGIRNLPN